MSEFYNKCIKNAEEKIAIEKSKETVEYKKCYDFYYEYISEELLLGKHVEENHDIYTFWINIKYYNGKIPTNIVKIVTDITNKLLPHGSVYRIDHIFDCIVIKLFKKSTF